MGDFEYIDFRVRRREPRVRVIAGLPTKNEAAHVARAVRALDDGLAAVSGATATIVNADGSDLVDTSDAFSSVTTRARKVALRVDGSEGKGRNVLEILRVAGEHEADVVCLFDADVTSLSPSWPAALITPVAGSHRAALAVPAYRRSRFEANGTNHIARPLLRMLTDATVRQPIGGEFALNKAMLGQALASHPVGSALRYGIDIHLTTTCLQAGGELSEVALGEKAHNPGFPKILKIGFELADTMLRSLLRGPAPLGYSIRTAELEAGPVPTQRPSARAVHAATQRVASYVDAHLDAVARALPSTHSLLARWRGPRAGLPVVDVEAWVRILVDATTCVAASSLLVTCEALVAMYLARVVAYWSEIEQLTDDGVERLLLHQCEAARDALHAAGGPTTLRACESEEPTRWDVLVDASPPMSAA